MLLQFWRNPEFIRHRRAELRRGRAIVVGSVVLVVCSLTVVVCWASQESQLAAMRNTQKLGLRSLWIDSRTIDEFDRAVPLNSARSAYKAILLMQFGALTFWSLLACAQGISRERERLTWDFQRATRLSSSELLIGKLLGEPVLAYFIVLCSLPFTLVLGGLARIEAVNIVSAYILLIASTVFVGLIGLWLSNLFDSRSRGLGLLGALAAYALLLSIQSISDSPFPALAGFSPLTLLLPLIDPFARRAQSPTIFGGHVPWLLATVLLYLAFGGWLVLMLLRNLKQDFREISLLSRWQAVACCGFLNFVFYAVFNPTRDPELRNGTSFIVFMSAINLLVWFTLGLTMLNSSERLRSPLRFSLRSSFGDHGLAWPWLAVSVLASYTLLIWGLAAWKNVLEFSGRALGVAAISFLVVAVFVTRDVLFIQWCKLTRLKAPVVKGALFLGLYYSAVGIICLALATGSEKNAAIAANVLAPTAAFRQAPSLVAGSFFHGLLDASVIAGVVMQLMAVAFLISAITGRSQGGRDLVVEA